MNATRRVVTAITALAALASVAVLGASAAFSAAMPPGQEIIQNNAKAFFDSVFADLAKTPNAINTPTNREKLRDIGWARLNTD
jgi:hypothetical protein